MILEDQFGFLVENLTAGRDELCVGVIEAVSIDRAYQLQNKDAIGFGKKQDLARWLMNSSYGLERLPKMR